MTQQGDAARPPPWLLIAASRSSDLHRCSGSVLTAIVRRLGPDYLRKLALETIEEAAAASHMGPVPRTRGLALALAWLLHYGKDGETLPRWPFENFWREIVCERQHDRWQGVNAAANAIYLTLGITRERALQSAFERLAGKDPSAPA